MDDHLLKLPRFIGLSRRTTQVLSQSISFAWHQDSIVHAGLAGKATLWMAMLRTYRRVCWRCPVDCICYDKPERLRFGTIFFSTKK